MFYEEESIIGETEHFIISQDSNGEYYISGFTNKGLGAKKLTIYDNVSIDGNNYQISYVDDIFKHHSYVRVLNVSIASDKVNIKGCNSIRVVQISQGNLIDGNSFFEGLRNINIYINDSTYTYENEEFCKNNNIYYDTVPEISNFDCLTIYEYVLFVLKGLGIILAGVAFAAIFIFIKSFLADKEYAAGFMCCIGLGIYAVGAVVPIVFGFENMLYLKGIPYLLPVSLAVATFVVKDEMERNVGQFLLGCLIASGVGIIIEFILMESITLILAELLAIALISLLVLVLKALYENVKVLFILLFGITLIAVPASVFLCDLLLKYVLSNMNAIIISGVISLIIIVILVLVLIKTLKNLSKTKYSKKIPWPKFNGIFTCKIFLPYGFEWEYKPVVIYKDEVFIFSGRVKSTKKYRTKSESSADWEKCLDAMDDSIKTILKCYYTDYPNAKSCKGIDSSGIRTTLWFDSEQ